MSEAIFQAPNFDQSTSTHGGSRANWIALDLLLITGKNKTDIIKPKRQQVYNVYLSKSIFKNY